MNERRAAHRYQLSLPLLVGVQNGTFSGFLNAQLRDISTAGVFFLSNRAFAVETAIELSLSLPVEVTRGLQVLVRASGRVVRVEAPGTAGAGCGTAATFQHYEIIRPGAASPSFATA